MCGISAVISCSENIVNVLYDSMFNLQHRGQESSGIYLYCKQKNQIFKSNLPGLVEKQLIKLENKTACMGIGHLRYPTSGSKTMKEIQPFSIILPYDISLVHNGNISNQKYIFDFLKENGVCCETTSDSELILKLFYFFMENDFNKITHDSIFSSVHKIYELCKGSFSVIIMIKKYGIIAFRDPYGIKPLSYCDGDPFIFASETVGIEKDNHRDLLNGEIIIIDSDLNKVNCLKYHNYNNLKPCLFEYIYFSRQESYINGVLVYDFREKAGIKMSSLIDPTILKSIDFVIPIPYTSVVSACSLANACNKEIKYPVMKNRYTHRTFINHGENIIKNIKKIKVIKKIVQGKNVLVVDDSIVRGNTSKFIVDELRAAGANQVHFVSCSPPIRFPNIYGIAIPTSSELIAHDKSIEEIRSTLNVDSLHYLPLNEMCNILRESNSKLTDFETSVFTGNYL